MADNRHNQKIHLNLTPSNDWIKICLFKEDSPIGYSSNIAYVYYWDPKLKVWKDGPELQLGRKCRSVAMVNGFNNYTYAVFISDEEGKIYMWRYEKDHGWDDEGEVRTENQGRSSGYNWISTLVGNDDNAQVALISTDDNKAYQLWQRQTTGKWYWGQFDEEIPADLELSTVCLGMGNDGNAQAILTDRFGMPHLVWCNKNGSWYWYGKIQMTGAHEFVDSQSFYDQSTETLQYVFLDTNDYLYSFYQDSAGNWSKESTLPIRKANLKGTVDYFETRADTVKDQEGIYNTVRLFTELSPRVYNIYEYFLDKDVTWKGGQLIGQITINN